MQLKNPIRFSCFQILLHQRKVYEYSLVAWSNTIWTWPFTAIQVNKVLVTRLAKGRDADIDLSALIPGMYYLTVEMDHRIFHSKVVKE